MHLGFVSGFYYTCILIGKKTQRGGKHRPHKFGYFHQGNETPVMVYEASVRNQPG